MIYLRDRNDGRKRSAPKTGLHSITIRVQTFRMRTSRIFERRSEGCATASLGRSNMH